MQDWPSTPGKRVGEHFYLHTSAVNCLGEDWRELVKQAVSLIGFPACQHYNVLKLHCLGDELSLLEYSDFFHDPFPSLRQSWRVSLSRQQVIYRNYEQSRNPPVLHRKELLVDKAHPDYERFSDLTRTAEELGLFLQPHLIGFREHWLASIEKAGYELIGSTFVPIANKNQSDIDIVIDESSSIRRYLTALSRSNFSAPVQALVRHQMLAPSTTVFDYGCGKGDDVRGLQANGIDATGWDPHYAPDSPKRIANIVNIGFVINVIEDIGERVTALIGAYEHATSLLSIAAMLTSEQYPDGRPYGDGYLSSRNTFQKYFTQSQLRDFIEHTLDTAAIAVGPGVYFVFKDKDLEQRFLTQRYGRQRQGVFYPRVSYRSMRQPRPRIDFAAKLFEANRGLFEALWSIYLDLGRAPGSEEVPEELRAEAESTVGSLRKAIRVLEKVKDLELVTAASQERKSDLLVFFAIQQFQKREPYKKLEQRLQRDMRHFFGDYISAQSSARNILFELNNLEAIDAACRASAENGFGWLEDSLSLQVHSSLLNRLPPLLRVYIGCASILCGDLSAYDIAKIHIRSGKVTLLKFDHFHEKPLPRLLQRVKIKLREQDFDLFNYGMEFPCPLLYLKSRFINEEFPQYNEQIQFDEALASLEFLDFSEHGPSEAELTSRLAEARWEVDGFKLVRTKCIPSIDQDCGQYFSYRDLIECGETQKKMGMANLPQEPDTYTALLELAKNVLDPVVDYYGMVKLTYGFCSQALAKNITRRIAPKLDQHACHEKQRGGRFVCERMGAAVDFLVEDEDMEEVARWIVERLPFDRLYFYGRNRPIHVSYGPANSRAAFRMIESVRGTLIPHRF